MVKQKFKTLACDWCLIAEYQSPEGHVNSTNGFEFSFQGLLLELRK